VSSISSIIVLIINTTRVVTFGIGYITGKALDVPFNRAKEKIFLMLQNRKKRDQSKLDVFMDDKRID